VGFGGVGVRDLQHGYRCLAEDEAVSLEEEDEE
jgi:hypothetical protein